MAALRYYGRSRVGRRPHSFRILSDRSRVELEMWLVEEAGGYNREKWWFGGDGALHVVDQDLAFATRLRWC